MVGVSKSHKLTPSEMAETNIKKNTCISSKENDLQNFITIP